MKIKFVLFMKKALPIVVITLAVVQLADIPFPKWLAFSLLILTGILYTVALIVEKMSRHLK